MRPTLKIRSRSITALLALGLALAVFAPLAQASAPVVQAVGAVGFTVGEMDREVEFYTTVLSFEKISDAEVWGSDYERLQGVFGLRMRVVQLRLGEETIELTEYLAPRGRPIPVDSRSNDRWFQHIAIVVSDIERAYAHLRTLYRRRSSARCSSIPARWSTRRSPRRGCGGC